MVALLAESARLVRMAGGWIRDLNCHLRHPRLTAGVSILYWSGELQPAAAVLEAGRLEECCRLRRC